MTQNEWMLAMFMSAQLQSQDLSSQICTVETHSNNNKHDSEEAIQSDYLITTKNTAKQKNSWEVFINIKPLREMTSTLGVKRSIKKLNSVIILQSLTVRTQHSFSQAESKWLLKTYSVPTQLN